MVGKDGEGDNEGNMSWAFNYLMFLKDDENMHAQRMNIRKCRVQAFF